MFGLNQGTLTEGEGLNMINLLVLTGSDQLLFILQILVTSIPKDFNEEVICTEPFSFRLNHPPET
jgi:hypothetical protein